MLSMRAKWLRSLTASWIGVTGHFARQLRERKSMLDWENILETFAVSKAQTSLSLNTSSLRVLGGPLAKQFQNQHSLLSPAA